MTESTPVPDQPDVPAPAPMVVFVHDLGGSPFSWEKQTAALPAGVRAAAPWLRGTRPGTSGRAETFTVADAADDVATTLRFDGPAVLVGHGMGARVVVRCALEHPDLVTGLVLAGPSPALGGAAAGLQKFLLRLLPARRFAGSTTKEQAARLAEEVGRDDDAARLGDLAVPVLVVVGERDRPAQLAARTITDALPSAHVEVVAGAGHQVMTDRTDEFTSLLYGFVAGTAPA